MWAGDSDRSMIAFTHIFAKHAEFASPTGENTATLAEGMVRGRVYGDIARAASGSVCLAIGAERD